MIEMSGQSKILRETRASVSELLAEHLARPVDQQTRSRAALHVLDWTGCAIAGVKSDAACAMREARVDDSLYLGALGNILEMDDVDKRALLHPGPVVIPAAIIASKGQELSSFQFLDAIVRGYEAMIRLGRAVGADHYRYWHNTGTCGPFAAAATAASIFKLDTERTVSALGLGGTQASGFWQTRHEATSHAKQLHTARAVHAGVISAKLSATGFNGPRTILEGEQGFFAATCGQNDPYMVVNFTSDVPWSIHDVSFKPWPACRHAHAAIDAALTLRADQPDLNKIEKIIVWTYADAIKFCDKSTPENSLSAKFSLQHSIAVCLARGKPKLSDFEGDSLNAQDITKIRDIVQVEESEAITARYPNQFGSKIEIMFSDGTRSIHNQIDALGDPENPVTEEQLITKTITLLETNGIVGVQQRALIEAALNLAISEDALENYTRLLDESLVS